MDTSYYLYAGYTIFWLVPFYFILKTHKKINELEKKMSKQG